jgi:hypothetical protein
MYFSKSSSNVAASEIQNLKNSLNFSKMQKICTKNSRLFSGKVGRLFPKTAFFFKKCPLFSMKFSINSEAGPDFLIVIFGVLPKGEILEKTTKNGRNLAKSHPKNSRNLCIN